MGYRVIKAFADLQDGGHRYKVGDAYPREGAIVLERRLESLLSANNRQRTPLIAETEVEAEVVETEPVEIAEEVPETEVETETKAKPKRGKKNKES